MSRNMKRTIGIVGGGAAGMTAAIAAASRGAEVILFEGNDSDFITGSATMMIATEDEELRQDSWEFMKWWAQPDTQVNFGREIEALLGSSARYATANKDAFVQLSWSADDIEVLDAQWEQTV